LQSGRAYTFLRPGFFAQNLGEAYRRDILEESRLYVPAGQGLVAFIDAQDIAAVATRVLTGPAAFDRQALLLTGGEAISFTEAASVLTAALGRTIRYEPASIPGYCWHLRRHRGLPWMQIAVQTILHVGLRRGDAERVDPTVERILGRKARTLADYVRDSAAVWRERASRGL
jgi:nucleoside-diphosphate-sugar epimerase